MTETPAQRLDRMARTAGCTPKELDALAAYCRASNRGRGLGTAARELGISKSALQSRLDSVERRLQRILDQQAKGAA